MNLDDKLPALRSIEILPVRKSDDDVYFAMHDPSRIAREPIGISAAGYFVLMYLDGEHTCADVQAAFRAEVGLELPISEILKVVAALDQALMLHGERFEAVYAERREAYRQAPYRDNRDRYPDGAALRQEIDAMLAGVPAAVPASICGLVAPHLDYARGGPCYAAAYAGLAQRPAAERFVILGTNHAGQSASVVATTKDFQTPLGLARTDARFIEHLEQRLGSPLCTHELDHVGEHSIELQVHVLQHIMQERPFEIVPILCPNACGPTGTAPADGTGPDLADFAGALAEHISASDRPTVIIASADLSHVGQRFGDPEPTTVEHLQDVERWDRELLSNLEMGDEQTFLQKLTATENPTRVCSSGCLYVFRRALSAHPCQVVKYHQAVDMEAETHVTCAAGVAG